jgi:hypothetical protein
MHCAVTLIVRGACTRAKRRRSTRALALQDAASQSLAFSFQFAQALIHLRKLWIRRHVTTRQRATGRRRALTRRLSSSFSADSCRGRVRRKPQHHAPHGNLVELLVVHPLQSENVVAGRGIGSLALQVSRGVLVAVHA